jgi:hypothetical protein
VNLSRFSLVLTLALGVFIGYIAHHLASTQQQRGEQPLPSCSIYYTQLRIAQAYGRVMDVKRVCVFLEEPNPEVEQAALFPCWTHPFIQEQAQIDCEEAERALTTLNEWIDTAHPQVLTACVQSPSCQRKAMNIKSYDGKPLFDFAKEAQ